MSRLSGQGFHNVEELVIHKKEKEIKFEPLFYFYRKFTVVFFAVPKSDSLRIFICLFYFIFAVLVNLWYPCVIFF